MFYFYLQVEITSSETQATLFVHDCEKSDMGQYCVMVENKISKDSQTYSIIVTGRLTCASKWNCSGDENEKELEKEEEDDDEKEEEGKQEVEVDEEEEVEEVEKLRIMTTRQCG